MNKSKTKGKSWEREVVQFLSKIYKKSFIRVPNSGAYVGGQNEVRKSQLSEEQIKLMRGDIVPPSEFPHFVAECKNYAHFPFHLLISESRIRLLDDWIKQVEHDSKENDLWLLFIKITRKGTYVVYDTRSLYPLDEGIIYGRYWFCDMEYFFESYQYEVELRWKGQYDGRTT
tara:strand:- start:8 stop:523 length:516 start_codon:yes stop_codon:yes gene_type:complete